MAECGHLLVCGRLGMVRAAQVLQQRIAAQMRRVHPAHRTKGRECGYHGSGFIQPTRIYSINSSIMCRFKTATVCAGHSEFKGARRRFFRERSEIKKGAGKHPGGDEWGG